MFIQETGDKNKPLMVLLHGGGVAGWMWNAQAEYFKKDWHILIPDLPGHGKSACEAFVSIEECAKQILDAIREKKAGRKVLLIGLSLGAQITVEIMCRLTDAVDAAVIQSALVIPMRITRSIIKPVIKYTYKLVQSKKFAKLQSKQLYIPDDLFDRYFEDSKKISIENLYTVFSSNLSYALPQNYNLVKRPMLVMFGGKEKSIMKKSAKLLSSISNASLYCAQDTGHGFSLANSDLFNSIVEDWLHNVNFDQ